MRQASPGVGGGGGVSRDEWRTRRLRARGAGQRECGPTRGDFVFFSSRRRHTRFDCDWSSDVCSSDLPKAGTTNSAVRAGVVSAEGGPTTWLQIPDDPRESYLPRMEWAGPNELILQRMNRLQNTERVMLADAATGATRTVLTERDTAWVDVVDEIQWLAKGTEILWTSERDGWRHVYRRSGEH